MRAIISPIIIVGIVIVVFVLIFAVSKSEILSENINNEIENDIEMHENIINKIEFLSYLNDATYACSHKYYCENLTNFLVNVTSCLHEKGYEYSLEYDGEFYINVSGFKDILNEGRLGCG